MVDGGFILNLKEGALWICLSINCSNPDGSLKSYDEVLKGMVNFMMMSQNMDRETAERAAKERMSKMPAWESK